MRRDTRREKPKVLIGTWAQAEGGKGGRKDVGHGSGSKHAAQGA